MTDACTAVCTVQILLPTAAPSFPVVRQEAVRLRPNYADAYTGMGVSLKELRRRGEAQACFETCVRLRPGCALSLGNLAGLYYEQVFTLRP